MAFMGSILTAAYLAMQDALVLRSTLEIQNLGDPTDFASLDSSAFQGTGAGEHVPLFVSASIQFNRTRTDMRNGQKRFVVGSEGDMLQGIWDAPFQAELAALGASVIAPWRTAAAPGVDVCNFVILKRFCVVEDEDPCRAYRLPDSDTEIDGFHYVPSAIVVRANARSQVSRKAL
jgi:hypothetical protein